MTEIKVTFLKDDGLNKKNEVIYLEEDVARQKEQQGIVRVGRKTRFTARELINREDIKVEYLIENIIQKESITLLGGSFASFKSYFSLHLGICVATGEKLFNNFKSIKGKVLIFDEENHLPRLKERTNKLMLGLGIAEDLEIIFVVDEGSKLNQDHKRFDDFKHAIEKHNPKLVICDSLTRFMVGSENDVENVRKLFDYLKQFINNNKCSFILLHHTKKPSSNQTFTNAYDIRGSTDFMGMVDNGYMIEKKAKDIVTLKQIKVRDNNFIDVLEFQIVDTNNGGINIKLIGTHPNIEQQTSLAYINVSAKIIEWLKDESMMQVTTNQIKTAFIEEHSTATINRAIKHLKATDKLKQLNSRGMFDVNI